MLKSLGLWLRQRITRPVPVLFTAMVWFAVIVAPHFGECLPVTSGTCG